jgi:hypothetical protein
VNSSRIGLGRAVLAASALLVGVATALACGAAAQEQSPRAGDAVRPAEPADLAVEVRLRADAGGEDRGGGLVWRARDAANHYVCRWNPLERNLRAYKVVEGRRVQLQSVAIDASPSAWHLLRAKMKGRVIEVSFHGKKAISWADTTFAEAGKVGLWTKADARSSFDDFKLEPAP